MSPKKLAKMSREELLSLAQEKKINTKPKITREELVEELRTVILQTETTRSVSEKTTGRPEPFTPFPSIMETQAVVEQDRLEQAEFELPLSYNETVVVLLVRDPYWVYAYWDFRPELKTKLAREFQSWERVPLTLRVYNLSRNRTGTGEPEYFDISVNHAANNWYINVREPGQQYQVEIGYYSLDGKFHALARSNPVTTPRESISDVIDEQWMIIDEHFRRLYRLAGGAGWGESSVELVESLLKRLEREAGSGVVSSISSPVGAPFAERRFWLVLDTELIVYGATEPNASLTLQGRPVKLRPDGTFTLRMALPDGTQTIPVTAKSCTGEDTITITTRISRTTCKGDPV